ncbi:MAG: hydrogenase maturation protease [Actinobacteria bacterium]|nr:hydrogenase maturation protease [Actinomycetota bacterium]
MRVHPGQLTAGPGAAQPACHTLVGGLGTPGLRDLDFGRQVVHYLENLEWPKGVVVEDLSYAAHLVLDRVQELRPAKVVLIGVAARGGSPGSLRRYRIDLTPPPPAQVHQGLSAAGGGTADLDHTLAVVRHWGAFPSDTTIVEVEPADCSFGPGFSEELGECIESIVDLVREEVGGVDEVLDEALPVGALVAGLPTDHPTAGSRLDDVSPELEQMVEHARLHERLRQGEPHRGESVLGRTGERVPLSVEARSRPYGVGLGTGGDWYDIIPRADGSVGVVVGDAPGRGTEAAAIMSELRAAVRAYAVLDDDRPGRLVERLDRFVSATSIGQGSALAYLHLEPASGRGWMSSAGECPSVMSTGGGHARLIGPGASPLLGATRGDRPELELDVSPEATLFLFTAGAARAGGRSLGEGVEYLRCAAARGPRPLGAMCDHVFSACVGRSRRNDDALVVALRLDPDAASHRGVSLP